MASLTDIYRERLLKLRAELGERVRRQGLPLVDTVFWDAPGPKIGGYLAFLAKKGQGSSETRRVDLRPELRHFNKLSELKRHLDQEHRGNHWYRGQHKRHATLYRGSIPGLARMGWGPIEFQLESLVPSAYRSIVRDSPASWSQSPLPRPPLDAFAAPLRAILNSNDPDLIKVFVEAANVIGMETIRLLMADTAQISVAEHLLAPGTTVSRAIARLISLAQHYEFGSVMVDVTRRVEIALTFATMDWTSGEKTRLGGGVIYRFDAAKVEKAANDMLKGGLRSHLLGPLAQIGVTDIHDIGFDLQRPKRQQGGSLFGLETAAAHFLLQAHEAMQAFEFGEDDLSTDAIPLMAHLRPDDDPGLAVFDKASRSRVEPLGDDEIAHGLNAAGQNETEIDRILSWRRIGIL